MRTTPGAAIAWYVRLRRSDETQQHARRDKGYVQIVPVELEGERFQPVVVFGRGGVRAPDICSKSGIGARFFRVGGDGRGAGGKEGAGGSKKSVMELAVNGEEGAGRRTHSAEETLELMDCDSSWVRGLVLSMIAIDTI